MCPLVGVPPDGDDVCSDTKLGSEPRRVWAEGEFGGAVHLRVDEDVRGVTPRSGFRPLILSAGIPVGEVPQLMRQRADGVRVRHSELETDLPWWTPCGLGATPVPSDP